MSIKTTKTSCNNRKTPVLFVPCFENHRSKGKKMVMRFFSPDYFPERKGSNWKGQGGSKRREGRGKRGGEGNEKERRQS